MIYNRKNEQVTQNAKFTFSTGVSAAEKPNISNAPEDLRSFDKTKELPVLSEYDKENITPYIPVRVSKFRLRRKLREIKKSAQPKRSAAGLFISFGVCFCLCSGIIYLAFAGIYAPKEICDAVIKLCGIVYPYDGGYETTDGGFEMSGKTYVPENTPKFLSQSSEKASENGSDGAHSSFTAASDSLISDERNNDAAQNSGKADVQAADSSDGGKSGSDGEIYYPIAERNMSAKQITALTNQTDFTPDTAALLKQSPKAFENLSLSDEPLVLILHTHATECYSMSDSDSYLSTEPTRSSDDSINMNRVGDELCDVLSDFGINAVHCTVRHDEKSFIKAYNSSLSSAKEYLEKYPSVKFVIDLHRDAILDGSTKIKPAISIGGEKYAQLMFVVGTNESGINHPNWQDNLCLALNLQSAAEEMYPGLFRQTNLRSPSFNQQLSPGFLLLEDGTCGNNLDEALRSVRAFGTVFASEIIKNAD